MVKEKKLDGVSIKPISRKIQLIDDYTSEAKSKNLTWAVTEADITEVRKRMEAHTDKTGEKLSMTAYIIFIVSRVAEQHKFPVNTLRYKKKRFYTFDDVDILTNIERTLDGLKKPVNYTVRKANKKTYREINDELQKAKSTKVVKVTQSGKGANRLMKIFPKLPRFIRKLIIKYIFRHPMLKKNLLGTVGVTAVGMMGKMEGRRGGNGHMIHITPHTLSVGVGGIGTHPATVDGEIINREFLDITIAMDHAIIDGAPATRFLHDLRYGLEDVYLDDPACFPSLKNEI